MDDALRTVFVAGVLIAGDAGAADGEFRFSIAAGKFGEHCVKLEAGRAMAYRFDASAPVDFNVHHHRGKDVVYPVKREATRRLAATFRAKATDDYCLMWENKGAATVTVEGRVDRR
jgi:hypothetical protein